MREGEKRSPRGIEWRERLGMRRVNERQDSRKIGRNWGLSQLGHGATRSRTEDGWHPNWERARKKEKGRRLKIREHRRFQCHEQCRRKFCGSDDVERNCTVDIARSSSAEREER